MLLKDNVAVIHGAGGAIGGAVAQTFARKGAKVYLSGRRLETVGSVAREISSHGGVADAARVDALDEAPVEAHIAYMVEKAGRIDVSFNAITAVPQRGRRASRSPSCRSTASWRRSTSTCARSSSRRGPRPIACRRRAPGPS
jgi:NADP-dependent 3-hydroxy acid dehydrogenase YdfG